MAERYEFLSFNVSLKPEKEKEARALIREMCGVEDQEFMEAGLDEFADFDGTFKGVACMEPNWKVLQAFHLSGYLDGDGLILIVRVDRGDIAVWMRRGTTLQFAFGPRTIKALEKGLFPLPPEAK